MRIYFKERPRPQHHIGDLRVKRAFLLFPRVIDHELRWLETACWEEKAFLSYTATGCGTGGVIPILKWHAVRWINELVRYGRGPKPA